MSEETKTNAPGAGTTSAGASGYANAGGGCGCGASSTAGCACAGMGPAVTAAVSAAAAEFMKRFAPSAEATGHFKAAHLEMLKGMRALIDQQISKQEQGAQPAQGTKISVE